MSLLQYITVKTQVRRLKYFSIALKFLSKSGLQKQIFSNLLIKWSKENHAELQKYKSSSGEIILGEAKSVSNSFNSYFNGLLQLELIIEQGNFIIPSKSADILNILLEYLRNDLYANNPYELTFVEKTFFLTNLFEKDYDILILVLELIYIYPSQKLEFYLENFQQAYLKRLEKKLENQKIENASAVIEAIQRISSWRSAKKYSEEYVPQRVNWLIDLGFIDEENWKSKIISLNDKATEFFANIKLNSQLEKEYNIFDNDWFSNSFILTISTFYFNKNNLTFWADLGEFKKDELIDECLIIAAKNFSVLGIPRLSAKSTLLMSSLLMLHKYSIVLDLKDIIDWIGSGKKISNRNYSFRRAEREGESYFIINYE